MVASGVGTAHLARLLLIARVLREQGHEVTFAAGGDGRLASDDGFETVALPEVSVTDFSENVYAAYTAELVERCVREERAVIEATRPDVVVADFRPTAAISTRIAQVPYVSVLNGYMTSAFHPTDVLLGPGTGPREAGVRVARKQRPADPAEARSRRNVSPRRERLPARAPVVAGRLPREGTSRSSPICRSSARCTSSPSAIAMSAPWCGSPTATASCPATWTRRGRSSTRRRATREHNPSSNSSSRRSAATTATRSC